LSTARAQTRAAELACLNLGLGMICSYKARASIDHVWGRCTKLDHWLDGSGGVGHLDGHARFSVVVCLQDISVLPGNGMNTSGNGPAVGVDSSRTMEITTWLIHGGWQVLVGLALLICCSLCLGTFLRSYCSKETQDDATLVAKMPVAPLNIDEVTGRVLLRANQKLGVWRKTHRRFTRRGCASASLEFRKCHDSANSPQARARRKRQATNSPNKGGHGNVVSPGKDELEAEDLVYDIEAELRAYDADAERDELMEPGCVGTHATFGANQSLYCNVAMTWTTSRTAMGLPPLSAAAHNPVSSSTQVSNEVTAVTGRRRVSTQASTEEAAAASCTCNSGCVENLSKACGARDQPLNMAEHPAGNHKLHLQQVESSASSSEDSSTESESGDNNKESAGGAVSSPASGSASRLQSESATRRKEQLSKQIWEAMEVDLCQALEQEQQIGGITAVRTSRPSAGTDESISRM